MSAAEGAGASGRAQELIASAAQPAAPQPQSYRWQPGRDAPATEARRSSSLLEINQALSGALTLKAAMPHVFEVLARHHGAIRAVVTLLQDDGKLAIEAGDGPEPLAALVKYRVGIAGRVVETGRPIVVPGAPAEPLPPGRASKRPGPSDQAPSCICVPIVSNGKAIGALTVDLACTLDRDDERTGPFLGLVASMLAQAIRIQRLTEDDRRRLEVENTHLRRELRERYDFSNIIGTSGPMRQLYEQVEQVAGTNTTVLIRGESGTGKELIASAIHYNSLRAKKPFVKVSCAALPDTLIESELFGYERGAFTGAEARRKGRFELADGGTLFLDEIGDINPGTQTRLLRVLQQREYERLGGTETIPVNVRVLVATNKNLEKAIVEGTFREDLYYRLNVFAIFVPPLRERKADLLLLADHFMEKLSRDHRKTIKRVSTPAIDALMSYHWPGNVRELENVLERAVLLCDGGVIHAHHLPATLQTAETSGTLSRLSLRNAIDAYERDLIQDALKTSRGNRAKAARLLDTTERIVNYKIKTLGIDYLRFRI
jgi:Nif-specific regulatory protein